MTHNQVSYLLGKRNADINEKNVNVRREELGLEADIAEENIRANKAGQQIGTAIGVAAIVVSVIIACLW